MTLTADGALGLAFDGVNLYVSTNQGLLLTLDANTGALLNSVTVAGGNLVELGAQPGTAAVPEPATMTLMVTGMAALVVLRRRRKSA